MNTLMQLVRRNMKVYIKNKSNIMFSFLTMIIILLLNTVFLGSVNEEYLGDFISLDEKMVSYITGSWLMAGIVVVNAFMVTTVMLSIMVEDEEKHKLAAFIIAPISRVTLTLSYIMAAFITRFVFAVISVGISQIYLYSICQQLLDLKTVIKVLGLIAVNIFSVVSIMMCLATRIKTSSAYGAFNTMMGTVIGFIAGIYLPMGSLPEGVQKVLKVFPILHGTALVREEYTKQAIGSAFAQAPQALIDGYKEYMGITLYWGDEKINFALSMMILLGSGILFTLLAAGLLSRKSASDR